MIKPPLSLKVRKRASLLAGVGPILIASCPAMLIAQVAVNTASVAPPAGTFETAPDNNTITDSDILLAVLTASPDTITGIRSGIGNPDAGNVLGNDTQNGNPAALQGVTISVLTPASNPGVVLDPRPARFRSARMFPPAAIRSCTRFANRQIRRTAHRPVFRSQSIRR